MLDGVMQLLFLHSANDIGYRSTGILKLKKQQIKQEHCHNTGNAKESKNWHEKSGLVGCVTVLLSE
jgi:hypothetical protein